MEHNISLDTLKLDILKYVSMIRYDYKNDKKKELEFYFFNDKEK